MGYRQIKKKAAIEYKHRQQRDLGGREIKE